MAPSPTSQTPWQERGMQITFHLEGCPMRFPFRYYLNGTRCTCASQVSGLHPRR